MIFAAQLWKDNGGRLENKNGDWMYMEETWILPTIIDRNKILLFQNLNLNSEVEFDELSDNARGQVIKNTIGKVLKVNLVSKGMDLKLLKHNKILNSENLLVLRHH